MSKLFAMEEHSENFEEAELDTVPEEGEVADVETEVSADMEEIDSVEGAVEDGVESADVLEQVEDVIEDSLEEGEGLDPVAAEAIRIAVESVCVRLGANPKSMYSLYATENFESASSRKHNTRIALESVKDFLSNLWEKIKAAVSNVWSKIKDFWNKHIANLARVRKALEAMKKRISATKGTSSASTEVKASGGLQKMFPGTGDLDDKAIKDFISAHETARSGELQKISGNLDKLNEAATKGADIVAKLDVKSGTRDVASEAAPLVNGTWFQIEETVENVGKDDEDSATYNLDITTNTKTGDSDRELFVASKDGLKSIVDETIKVIKASEKARDNAEKNERNFEKAKKAVDKQINEMATDTPDGKKARRKTAQVLRAFSTANSKIPAFEARIAALDVVLAKGVLAYCGACLKTYKTA